MKYLLRFFYFIAMILYEKSSTGYSKTSSPYNFWVTNSDKLISGRQTGQGTTLNHCEQLGMATGTNPLDLPSSDPISMKEKPLYWVTYLISRVEISP
jgi:hypothetical protein